MSQLRYGYITEGAFSWRMGHVVSWTALYGWLYLELGNPHLFTQRQCGCESQLSVCRQKSMICGQSLIQSVQLLVPFIVHGMMNDFIQEFDYSLWKYTTINCRSIFTTASGRGGMRSLEKPPSLDYFWMECVLSPAS